MTRRHVLVYIIASVILFMDIIVMAENIDNKLIADLHYTLDKFKQMNQLDDLHMARLLGEIVLNTEEWKKGGVGIIDENVFILTDRRNNSIRIFGKEWEGKESSVEEVVVIDGNRVVCCLDGADTSKLKIVLFSPSEVHFIDLSNNTGGKYVRQKNKSEGRLNMIEK